MTTTIKPLLASGKVPQATWDWLSDYRRNVELADWVMEHVHDQFDDRLKALYAQAEQMDLAELERLIRALPGGYWRMEMRRVWRERSAS